MELDKHRCKQDLSFNPTWLTEPAYDAHVYTMRNTADHYSGFRFDNPFHVIAGAQSITS